MKCDQTSRATRVRALAIGLCLLIASPVLADRVRLLRSVTLEPGAPLTLGDVASLQGASAERHAGLVIAADVSQRLGRRSWAELPVDEVRALLRERGVQTGRLEISGGSCTIRVRRTVENPEPQAAPEPAPVRGDVISAGDPGTVRTMIARAVADAHGVPVEHVRLTFEDPHHRILGIRPDDGRISISPITSAGPRHTIDVEVFRDQRTVAGASVRVVVEVFRPVVVVTETIRRGDEIRASGLAEEQRWIEPGVIEPVRGIEEATGRLAATRIEQGDLLFADDLEKPVLVRRGEQVRVVCLNGTVKVELPGRAGEDGARGDMIEVRRLGSRQEFTARVDGPGRVVLDLDSSRKGSVGK